MSLNLFDAEKHHIALGALEDPAAASVAGLVGYWKLDDDLSEGTFVPGTGDWRNHDNLDSNEHKTDIVRDSSGLGNHLSYTRDAVSPVDIISLNPGVDAADSVYSFKWANSKGCCERLGVWNGITTPVKTISFWFKTPATGTPQGYLLGSHQVNGGGGGFGANFGWGATLGGMPEIMVPGSVPGKLQIVYANNSYPSAIVLQGPVVVNDAWYHVVIVSDGTTNLLRVNGVTVDTYAGVGNILADSDIKVGIYGYKAGFQWLVGFAGNITLDEISMWIEPRADVDTVDDGPLIGWTLENAYAKFMQKETKVGGSDFGGTLDLIASDKPEVSRWTQDEFTGGAFQYSFDTDQAMFADCIGYMPSQQSKSLTTVAPVFFKKAFNPEAQSNPGGRSNTTIPHSMFTVAGSIFVGFEHGILRYLTGTDATVWGNTNLDPGLGVHAWYAAADYDRNEQCIYALVNFATAGQKPYLIRLDPETLALWGTFNQTFNNAPEKTRNQLGYGMQINDQHIVLGIGLRLYTVDPPEKPSDPTDLPVWTHIGRLPGRWIDSVPYNGMTYILTSSADSKTQVVAFDGTYILPIANLAFNFSGRCMAVYGGRVYIGGVGTDISGEARYAELHELTGSSTRLVRTFAPESYQSHTPFPKDIWDLTVAEGLLWWSEKNVRLWTYDLTGDAFFGSSKIQHPNVNFYTQVVGRERLWLWGSHDTATDQHGIYRVAIAGDTVQPYEGTLTTSDFLTEFALEKRWHEIVVLARYHEVTRVEYSTDGGANWFPLGGGAVSTEGDLKFLTYPLDKLATSKVIRFRIHQPMGTTVDDYGELIAYTVSFSFTSPTGSLKHGWNLIINGAENVEGRDGSSIAQDVDLMKQTLWGWAEIQKSLTFKDLGGKIYTVKMQDFVEQQPIIGPNVTNGVGPEAYFAVTLMEV